MNPARTITLTRTERDGNVYAKPSEPMVVTRAVEFAPATLDEKARTVDVTWTTGARVRRRDFWGDVWFESLSTDPKAVRLERLNTGAPVLDSHQGRSSQTVVGVVVDGTAQLAEGKGTATLRFSADPDAERVFAKVREGILRNISVGYKVHEWQVTQRDGQPDEMLAVDWEPYELSVVPMPADAGAQIRAAWDDPAPAPAPVEGTMSDKTQDQGTRTGNDAGGTVVQLDEVALRKKWAQEEKAYRETAEQVVGLLFHDDATKARAAEALRGLEERAGALDSPRSPTPDEVRERLLKLRAELDVSTHTDTQHSGITAVGRDATERIVRAIGDTLEHRFGLVQDLPEQSRGVLYGNSLQDLIRERLELAGVRTRGMTDGQLWEHMLASRLHTTGDFPTILANVLDKKMKAWMKADERYRWYQRIFTRNDFKDFKVRSAPDLSKFAGVLPTVLEGADYLSITIGEGGETWQLAKRGAEFPFTWEMMVNDDLGAFMRIPMEFADIAVVTFSYVAAQLFMSNQTMGDGIALFHATSHFNLSTSGGDPDVDKLDELDQMLRTQKKPYSTGPVVGRAAQIGLFADTHRKKVEQLYSDRYSPTTTTVAPTVPLTAENRIYVPHFTTKYVLCTGRPGAAEYGHLQGEGELYLSRRAEEKNDSLIYHARTTFAAHVMEERDFAQNPGA